MRRSLAPFSGPESLVHTRSLADFITTTSGLGFRYTPRFSRYVGARSAGCHTKEEWCRCLGRSRNSNGDDHAEITLADTVRMWLITELDGKSHTSQMPKPKLSHTLVGWLPAPPDITGTTPGRWSMLRGIEGPRHGLKLGLNGPLRQLGCSAHRFRPDPRGPFSVSLRKSTEVSFDELSPGISWLIRFSHFGSFQFVG
jgi:hypothetical protein